MKKFLNIFFAILAVGVFSLAISVSTGINPMYVAPVATVLSFATPAVNGLAFTGLNKEIWLDTIMEGFYADDSFLSETVDMSMWVDNNTINLAEAGVDPDVLIDNSTYPIPTAERTDSAIAIALETYDTENTVVRNAEAVELSYDKRESVMRGHKSSLRMKFMEKAIHAYAPASDTANTPVIETTGTTDGSGQKKITWNDIITLSERFDEAEIPEEGRVLVLSAKHKAQLKEADLSLFKTIFKDKETYLGFKFYTLASKRMPVYNDGTSAKVAYGAAAAGTDTYCSVAFHKEEVMRADGTNDMFAKLKDPQERGDIIGFQKRGIAMPIRNKGIGSIISAAV